MNINANIGAYLPSGDKLKVGSTIPFTQIEAKVNSRCLIAKHLYRVKYNGSKPIKLGFTPLSQAQDQEKETLTILAEVPQSALYMERVTNGLVRPSLTLRDILRFYMHRPQLTISTPQGKLYFRAKLVSPLAIKFDYLVAILTAYANNKPFLKKVIEGYFGQKSSALAYLSIFWKFDMVKAERY